MHIYILSRSLTLRTTAQQCRCNRPLSDVAQQRQRKCFSSLTMAFSLFQILFWTERRRRGPRAPWWRRTRHAEQRKNLKLPGNYDKHLNRFSATVHAVVLHETKIGETGDAPRWLCECRAVNLQLITRDTQKLSKKPVEPNFEHWRRIIKWT